MISGANSDFSLMSLLAIAMLVIKVTAIATTTVVVGRLIPRSSASFRHLLYLAGVLVLLALPVAALVMPAVTVPIDRIVASQSLLPTQSSQIRSPASQQVGTPSESTIQGADPLRLAVIAVVVVWITGIAALLLRMLLGMREMAQISRSGEAWSRGQALASALAVRTGIRRRVTVMCHAEVRGPIAGGVLRSILVMPTSARSWTEAEIQRALTHELEHVRRIDPLSQLITNAACALYWFHPLVWRMSRCLRIEAERACDDAVVRHDDPADYAAFLVGLATSQRGARPRQTILAMAHRADMSIRVSAILDASQARRPAGLRSAVTAVVAAAAFAASLAPLTLVAAPSPQARSTSNEQPLPRLSSACERELPSPAAQPEAGSSPVFLSFELCFDSPFPVILDGSMRSPEVYHNAIRVSRFVSKPSRKKWTPFTNDLTRIIQEDLGRLNLLDGMVRTTAEVNDYIFPNGVVGKMIAYHILEQDRPSRN